MPTSRPSLGLSEEQAAGARRIYERLRGGLDEELKSMARPMASKANHRFFGETEFELRDRVHELGTCPLEGAADERQKKGALGIGMS